MKDFIQNEYDFGLNLNSKEVNSDKFLDMYNTQANECGKKWKQDNYGNENYHKSTNQTPKSLIRLINETRP